MNKFSEALTFLSNDRTINMLVILLCCEYLFFSIIVEFLGYHKLVPAELKRTFLLYKKKLEEEKIKGREHREQLLVLLLKYV